MRRLALLIPLVLLALACRPIVHTTYIEELNKPGASESHTIDSGWSSYRLYKITEDNRGNRKGRLLIEVDP